MQYRQTNADRHSLIQTKTDTETDRDRGMKNRRYLFSNHNKLLWDPETYKSDLSNTDKPMQTHIH